MTIARIFLLLICLINVQTLDCQPSDKFSQSHRTYLSNRNIIDLFNGPESTELGQGGFGAVKRIPWNDESLPESKRFVAIKKSLQESSDSLLIDEGTMIETLSAASQDHFPKLYGCITDAYKRVYLAMECFEGSLETYDQSVRTDERNSLYRAFYDLEVHSRLWAYYQLAEAIFLMHKEQIIHHDIKPENIVVQSMGTMPRLKIIDFGVAEKADSEYISGSGSLPYFDKTKLIIKFSPSRFNTFVQTKKDIKPKPADLFAFIITIFELETSRAKMNYLKDFSPPALLFDCDKMIKHRIKLVKSEEWMKQRNLNICTPEKDLCFSTIVANIMRTRRRKIKIKAESLRDALKKLYEVAQANYDSRLKKKSLALNLRLPTVNEFHKTPMEKMNAFNPITYVMSQAKLNMVAEEKSPNIAEEPDNEDDEADEDDEFDEEEHLLPDVKGLADKMQLMQVIQTKARKCMYCRKDYEEIDKAAQILEII